MTPPRRDAADIRAQLDHPVIDADGHVVELVAAALPYLRESLGQPGFDEYVRRGDALPRAWNHARADARPLESRLPQSGWWGSPVGNPRDLATAMLPRLMHERLDELGIDYMVLYPTYALGTPGEDDEEIRRGLCHGYNEFFADVYGPFADRLTVAGMIPMHTPEEAVAELEHCAGLGVKVVGIPQGVVRPIPRPVDGNPWLWPGQRHWNDTFGLDSAFDYDPVWAAFHRLGYAVTCHAGMGRLSTSVYTSPTNFSFNQLGSFVAHTYPLCKSLFLGGVTRRFPRLPIAFLECGVGWASVLLANLVELWEKRNVATLDRLYDPRLLDVPQLARWARDYGADLVASFDDAQLADLLARQPLTGVPPRQRDDWVHLDVGRPEDIVESFTRSFWFGCEADDRTVAFAWSLANPFGAELQATFSSDVGHFEVPSMARVLPDAHRLVEDGLLDDRQFRRFVFEHAARLYTQGDPDFFDGTPVARYLAARDPAPPEGPTGPADTSAREVAPT